jgi:hypothetical protein
LTTFANAGLTKGMPPPEGYTQDELGDPEWENNALEGDARGLSRALLKFSGGSVDDYAICRSS